MAYLPQDENLDERLRQAAEQSTQQLSGQSGVIASGNSSTSNSGGIVQRPGGNQFANIGQYLVQNDPSQLAERVSGVIKQAGGKAKESLENLRGAYRDAVDRAVIKLDEDLLRRATATANLSDEDRNKVKQMRTGSYSGPNQLSDLVGDYSDVLARINQANSISNLEESEEGRAQLAREVTQGRKASSGVVGLNNLLLSSSPEARAKLKESADKYRNLNAQLTDAERESIEMAQRGKEQSAAVNRAVQDELSNSLDRLNSDVDRRLAKERWWLQQKDQNMRDIVNDLAISRMDLTLDNFPIHKWINGKTRVFNHDLFGISESEGARLYDVLNKSRMKGVPTDLRPFLRTVATPEDFGRGEVMSPEEVARLMSLADLAGVEIGPLSYGRPTRLSKLDAEAAINYFSNFLK
jgi:hypothetical protein